MKPRSTCNDTETGPVKSAPGAEWVTAKDGKITYSRNVFDSAPIVAALQASSRAARPSRASSGGLGSAGSGGHRPHVICERERCHGRVSR